MEFKNISHAEAREIVNALYMQRRKLKNAIESAEVCLNDLEHVSLKASIAMEELKKQIDILNERYEITLGLLANTFEQEI